METKQITPHNMLGGYEAFMVADLLLMTSSKKEAKSLGEPYYFNGVCVRGHLAIRDTETGRCLKCLDCDRKRDYELHREARITKVVEYNNQRYIDDHKFKASKIARGQLQRIIERSKLSKSKGDSSFDILGYSAEDFKFNIESKFLTGMSWDNYGSVWQIDHIKAVALFDIQEIEDISKVNALDNLQPLFVTEHKVKTMRDMILIRESKVDKK